MMFARCKMEEIERTGKTVAVIGAGPAGLCASGELRCMGHEVVVYDMLPAPGGLLLFGIPDSRIKKDKVRESINEIRKLGVEFKCGIKVGRDIKLKELVNNHDAVLVATGTWETDKLGIPGENLPGVITALHYIVNTYMEKMNYKPFQRTHDLYGRVAVIGGGLTAIDACYVAKERGAKKVYLLYRRTREQAPAGRREFDKLESVLGAEVHELTQPIEFIGDEHLEGIRVVDMKLGVPDSSGRPKPEPIPNSERVMEMDNALTAVGLLSTPPESITKYGIELGKRNTIKTDKKYRTKVKGVFAAGDVRHGASMIGPAMKSGREASRYINEYLKTGEWSWGG